MQSVLQLRDRVVAARVRPCRRVFNSSYCLVILAVTPRVARAAIRMAARTPLQTSECKQLKLQGVCSLIGIHRGVVHTHNGAWETRPNGQVHTHTAGKPNSAK